MKSRIIYAAAPDLLQRVMVGVESGQRKRAVRNVSLSSLAFLFSVSGLVYVGAYLYEGLSRSGFMEFLSLFVSDTRLALSYAGDYASSLVEAVPAVEFTVFLAAALACSFFIWNIITNVSILRHGNRTITA